MTHSKLYNRTQGTSLASIYLSFNVYYDALGGGDVKVGDAVKEKLHQK